MGVNLEDFEKKKIRVKENFKEILQQKDAVVKYLKQEEDTDASDVDLINWLSYRLASVTPRSVGLSWLGPLFHWGAARYASPYTLLGSAPSRVFCASVFYFW